MPRDKYEVQFTSEYIEEARWMPESKRWGDRFPRTMFEAFGHGARLDDPDRRHWLDKRIGVICAAGIVGVLASLALGWI